MKISRLLALTTMVLLQAATAPAYARGGWDGNGLRVSGVSAAALGGPASVSPAAESAGTRLRYVELPSRGSAPARVSSR